MAKLDAVIKVDWDDLEVNASRWGKAAFAVADAADSLYDALFAKQDLWSDPCYREIQVAAVKVDVALQELQAVCGYVREENRAT